MVDPERLQPADQRRRERGDHEEGQLPVVERREQVGEDQPGGAADDARAEPRRRLDPPYGHAERGGDLAVVGDRAHRGAESRDAEEDGRRRP